MGKSRGIDTELRSLSINDHLLLLTLASPLPFSALSNIILDIIPDLSDHAKEGERWAKLKLGPRGI